MDGVSCGSARRAPGNTLGVFAEGVPTPGKVLTNFAMQSVLAYVSAVHLRQVTTGGEEGRGRFRTTKKEPARIADREKKAALKT